MEVKLELTDLETESLGIILEFVKKGDGDVEIEIFYDHSELSGWSVIQLKSAALSILKKLETGY